LGKAPAIIRWRLERLDKACVLFHQPLCFLVGFLWVSEILHEYLPRAYRLVSFRENITVQIEVQWEIATKR
jgi:hypothetical protein